MDRIATVLEHAPRCARPVDAFETIIGSSPAMLEAKSAARRLATCPRIPVLLQGETGVGKEVFAQALHRTSHDAGAPFVAINCGALSPELLASELFGYADGAFTGARRGGHEGKLSAADGGTLFLDEFGEMPKALQPQLLRALESGEYQRVGENRTRVARFRLITATNCELPKMVENGSFRRDLYYRAAVTTLTLPPLRERGQDIVALFRHLQKQVAAEYGLSRKPAAPDLNDALLNHLWPGNVRELKNVVIAASLTARGAQIRARDLPALRTQATPASLDNVDQVEDLRTLERRAICDALRAENGNLSGAARALGLAKSTLHAKLKRYGITRESGAAHLSHA
ncbi:MAG: sigma-54 interaction domain-containing protein [Gammaproteobacteria bacterium]